MIFFDVTFALYLFSAIVGITGFFLFLWWWIKVKQASFVYKCFCFLMLSWAYQNAVAAFSRTLYLIGDRQALLSLFDTLIWKYRILPSCLIITFVIVAMILRIRKTLRESARLK